MSKKSKASSEHFRVRDSHREWEGEYSVRQLLKKISEGKLVGEEEIASAPLYQWKKVSAHPLFYDAFLKRLYQGEYESEAPPEQPSVNSRTDQPPAEPSQVKNRFTNLGEPARTRQMDPADIIEGDDAAKTRQMGDHKDGTSQGQNFDDLFSEVSAQAPKPSGEVSLRPLNENAEEGQKEKTPLPVTVNARLSDVLSDPLPAIEAADSAELPPIELPPAPAPPAKNRRPLIYGAIAVLVVLYFAIGDRPAPAPTKKSDPRAEGIRQIISDTSTKEEKIKTLVDEGDRLFENDTPLFHLGAAQLYSAALEYDESNPIILGRFAESTARLVPEGTAAEGLDSQVKDAVSRGQTSDPQYSQFFRAQALVALAQNKPDDAKKLLEFAVQSDPANAVTLVVSAEVLYALGELEKSKELLRKVLPNYNSSIRARHLLARIALEQRDLAGAQKEAFDTLRLNPLHGASYYVLGRVALEQGRKKDAQDLFETTGSLAKFSPKRDVADAYQILAKLYEGNEANIKKAYQLAYYYYPEGKAGFADKLKGLDLDTAKLAELAGTREYSSSYFSEQGESLVAQKKFRDSFVFFQAAALLQPDNGNSLVRLGEVGEKFAQTYDDFRTVVSYYQRAIERDPQLVRAYIRLGLLESEQYNLERAFKLLKQAEALAPQESEPYVALGKYYYRTKDIYSAIEQFLKANQINPANSETIYYAGLLRLMLRKDAEKEALDHFHRAYLLDPTNYDALVEWLKLKVVLHEKSFGIKFVRNLIELEPDNANYYWALGEIYAANKEFRRSIDFFHKALDIDNRSSKVRMALARSLEAVGELEKAVPELGLASRLDRRNNEGFFRAAELLFQLRNFKEAENELRILISVCPNYPGVHRALSRVMQVKRQKDLAVEEMRMEVKNNPLNAKFRIELAELLMDYERFEDAVKELTEVTNLAPPTKGAIYEYDKIRGYLLLSRSYRALNRCDSAEGSIRLALQQDSNDAELHRELGYVYHCLQRDKEAVAAFEFYLNRSPAANDAAQIKALMQSLQIDE